MKNHVTLKKIDNYYLDQSDVLGKGAYSVVYKGVNIQNNNPVAIKTVKLLESNLQVELARREI
jgi:serine/threonine protein kinase